MATAADLVERTRGYLDGAHRDALNELAADISDTETNIVLGQVQPSTVGVGNVLSVGTESMLVWSYDPTLNKCSVRRGFAGTTAVAHSQDDLVRVNPRWTDFQVFTAVNQALHSLSSGGLFAVKSLTRTWTWSVAGLDLATDMVGDQVLEVAYQTLSGLKDWKEVYDYVVRLNVSTSDYLSGKAVFITSNNRPPEGATVRITYQGELNTLANLSDDVESVSGLAASAVDLPAIGAAIDLLAGSPVQRADVTRAPASRRPEEVSTSDVLNSGQALRALWQRRLGQELDQQSSQWPVRLKRWAL